MVYPPDDPRFGIDSYPTRCYAVSACPAEKEARFDSRWDNFRNGGKRRQMATQAGPPSDHIKGVALGCVATPGPTQPQAPVNYVAVRISYHLRSCSLINALRRTLKATITLLALPMFVWAQYGTSTTTTTAPTPTSTVGLAGAWQQCGVK